jgi:hypothetical protein
MRELITIFLWLALYTGGVVVGTSKYREIINNSSNIFDIASSCLIVFLFYTLSNVAILCCLASMIGGICRGSNSLLALAANGLFIYLILISGLLLLGTSPFDNLNQAQYTRLAGTASLFAFICGYSPGMLGKLVNRIEEMVKEKS